MNPCLIQYSDGGIKPFADLTRDTAANFANTFGLDYINESTGSIEKDSHMKKVELALQELNAGRPYVVYADSDIVFNKVLDTTFLTKFTASMSMFNTALGYETSFFIVKDMDNVREFLNMWISEPADRFWTDEVAFNLLYNRHRWIRDMIKPIPVSYITTIFEGGDGTIGKHFYASSSPNTLFAAKMYKKRRFD